ncbi:xyloglucan endotransglucosylase protein 7-like [Typha latifolia]|uniref:xyloglucan endotransglucosylase protein 7-like n=1 Tax=Typha latifolia TaxID=4733 RepID=UPI003C2FBA0D
MRKPNFSSDFTVTWGGGHATILGGGEGLQFMMDKFSGSGVESKSDFLFGRFDVQIKLIPGNSAGTITSFYLSSQLQNRDEIDFEFLGSTSADLYKLHTNIYINGEGGREKQFHFWFDPTADFHTYSILWNPQQVIWYVDGSPIRVFKKPNSSSFDYPQNQLMKIQASLWDGSNWIGRVDWNKAPFIVHYRDYKAEACVWLGNISAASCGSDSSSWMNHVLSNEEKNEIALVQNNYITYDYCNDPKRASEITSLECSINT